MVITAGSDIDVDAVSPYADAIVFAWYPGEQGGNALADIVFGKIPPSGHLSITFYKSIDNVPDYKNYHMIGHTYRYYNDPVQYPFGFGLSYTSFTYTLTSALQPAYKPTDIIKAAVFVKNEGQMNGDEVVQAYITYPGINRMPIKELKDFKRVTVNKGEAQSVNLSIPLVNYKNGTYQPINGKLSRYL